VRDEVRLDASGLPHQVGETAKQVVVRDRFERPLSFHAWNIGLPFSNHWDDERQQQ
jgi:hypothetical protein